MTVLGHYIIAFMVLCAIIFGAWLYVKTTNETLASLNQQVAGQTAQIVAQKTTLDEIQKDIKNVAAIQQQTATDLTSIRTNAATAAQKIRTQITNQKDPKALQPVVNQDTANALDALQGMTR